MTTGPPGPDSGVVRKQKKEEQVERTRSVKEAGALAAAGAIAVTAFGTFAGETKNEQTSGYWMLAGFIVVVTFLVFALLVSQALRSDQATNAPALSGFISGIMSVLTIVAFWSGLPVVLGAAGVLLGVEGRKMAAAGQARAGFAAAAIALGSLAIVASVAAVIGDKI
jgi:hypothetical protein